MKGSGCIRWKKSMTSLREALRQLLLRKVDSQENVHDAEFSYAVHWAKLTRGWDADRRKRVHALVKDVIRQPDFVANEFERRYSIMEIGASKYSGASLVALEKVLSSFDNEDKQEE
jgi:hypothetical protein